MGLGLAALLKSPHPRQLRHQRVPAPAAAPAGNTVVATVELTAIVTAINHATREVTLKKDDGTEVTFVASEDVKNLPQVKVGDVLHVVYAEALAYEVRKGGTTAAPVSRLPAAQPSWVRGRQVRWRARPLRRSRSRRSIERCPR